MKPLFSAEEAAGVKAPLESARTLPPSAYTSAAVFEAELRHLFYKEWVCVAREDQIPESGDYLAVTIIDQPLIIARQKDGSIHAMSSICPHRAMPVVSDSGTAAHFQCPYHLWKFGLDGQFISAPHMDGVSDFPDKNCQLKSVSVECWEGFILVNLDSDASPLAPRLAGLSEIVSGYRMKDMVVAASQKFDSPWNWKILIENFMEAYHHVGPHNESVQPNYAAKDSYVTGSVENGWSVLHMPEVRHRKKEASENTLPNIEGLSEKQKKEILACLIMPSCMWLNTPSVAFWYELKPHAFDDMTLHIHTLLPRALTERPDGKEIADAVKASIEHIHLEDIAANEGPWKGLHAPLTGQGKLSLLEESIWQINQWWITRLQNKLLSSSD